MESLARFILDADPAIAGVGTTERPVPSLSSSGSSISSLQGLEPSRVLSRHSSMPQPTHLQHPPRPSQHQLPSGPSSSGKREGRNAEFYFLIFLNVIPLPLL